MKKISLIFLLTFIVTAGAFAQNAADINKAYNTLYMRGPNVWESIASNYNQGHWNNYKELEQYVIQYNNSINGAGITVKFSQATFNNSKIVAFYQNGSLIGADLVAAGGGNLVAAGGGNLVAAGGGNLVAAGGGNLVAAGGGNLVAAGGGNLAITTQTQGVTFGSEYTIKSAGMKVIKTSGSGAIIIR